MLFSVLSHILARRGHPSRSTSSPFAVAAPRAQLPLLSPFPQKDAFKFGGPAPEVINGRLAMAFLPILASLEASSGKSARQLGMHLVSGGLALPADTFPFLTLALAIILASLAPMRVGAIAEAVGPFTPAAERANGRAAMLGWAALLWLEAHAGGVPFF